MTIGVRLKYLRKQRDWTLEYVAKRLRLSGHSTYSNWEYGRTEPDLDMITRLAELYEVDVEYLVTGVEPANKGYVNDNDYVYDIEELLANPKITFGNKLLTENEKRKVIKIIELLLE